MNPEQCLPQIPSEREVSPAETCTNPSDSILSAVAGAIEFKQAEFARQWSDDSLSLLHAHLSERFGEIEKLVGTRWIAVSTLVSKDAEIKGNSLYVIVNEHQIPIRTFEEFYGNENNGILMTSATMITRSIFKKALVYLQHGVSNEKELKDKTKKGSAYTRTGKGRSSSFKI